MTKSNIPVHKKHWRDLAGKEYLVGEEFQGQTVQLTIKDVQSEMVPDSTGKKSKKVVLMFKETDRKIVMNATNLKAITRITKSGIVGDWIGHTITFTTERGTWFGVTSDAIRVKEDHSKVKV